MLGRILRGNDLPRNRIAQAAPYAGWLPAGPVAYVRSGEEMDQLFEDNSVTYMISSRLRYNDVDWPRATAAAAKVVAPGGRVEMNIWCQGLEALQLKLLFERAGFRNVRVAGTGVGTMLHAER